jgi:antitoxin component YwqK of YwqJK toxin-antitoxin module
MSQSFCNSLARGIFIAAVLFGGFVLVPRASAADADATAPSGDKKAASDKGESSKVEPYTGPPIYLDESEPPPAPTIANRQKATSNYPDGKLRWEREVARLSDNSFVADGFYREFHPNGELFVEGTYKKGRQEGKWVYWYDNGTKNREVTYENGRPNGAWETFRADGTLASKRSYKNGIRDGEWITYDETGKEPRRIESYADGKAEGEWKLWFPSGQLNREMSFKSGQRDGPIVEYREDGSKALEGAYADGKLQGTVTLWSTDGRKAVQEYDAGRLVSEKVE